MKKIISLTIVGGFLAVGTTQVFAEESDVSLAIKAGEKELVVVPSLDFGEIELKEGSGESTNETAIMTVSDHRGTGEGWTISASISDFIGLETSRTLKGAQVTLPQGAVSSELSLPEFAPVANGPVELTFESKPILTAKESQGLGIWNNDLHGSGTKSSVKFPVDSYIDNYSATITWIFGNAPISE